MMRTVTTFMQINYMRASTVGTYKDCPWKFFLTYVIGFESKAGKKALLGTIVHHVMELMAKSRKTGHYLLNSKLNDPDFLLDVCWKHYTTKFASEFEFLKADKTFCKKQVDTVLNSKFHPFNLKVIRTEQQFELDVLRSGFEYDYKDHITGERKRGNMKLRGTVDLITEADPETIEVIDYKTGKRTDWVTGEVKDIEAFFKDLQLRLYDLAISVIYSKYKYRMLTIFFTQDGGPFTVTFSEQDLQKTIEALKQIYQQILADKTIDRLIDDSGRRAEHWKCDYVCQFGKVPQDFMADDGEVITKMFRRDPRDNYPDVIEENNKTYFRVSDNNRTLCTRYRKLFEQHGLEEGSKMLYQLSIEGKGQTSRRNDYSNPKITKGVVV
jgi:hypothetical protein